MIFQSDSRVLKEPAPQIVVLEMGDSSINYAVRPWVKADDYFDVYFEPIEKIKKQFDAEGISIPFPQRVVHVRERQQA